MRQPPVRCPSIGNHSIMKDEENRMLIVDNILIRFTVIEYRILLQLLAGVIVADPEIIHIAFNCTPNDNVARNLGRHIDRMRSKLRPVELTVSRVVDFGYVLLPFVG